MDITGASQVIGAGLDIASAIGNIGAGKRQQKRQKELMDIQNRNQRGLNEQGQQLAMQTWNDTNAGAQVKHLEDAGLNVGLMYEKGGVGGTTSAGSGGSAASGSAGMEIQTKVNGMEMASQLASQELMKANADKARAEAENLRGADRENTEAKTLGQKIQNEIAGKTIDEAIGLAEATYKKVEGEAGSAIAKATVDADSMDADRSMRKATAINEVLKKAVMESGIKLNDASIRNMAEQVAIGKFNANNNAEFQGLDKVAGSQVNKVINKIYEVFGIKEETNTQKTMK